MLWFAIRYSPSKLYSIMSKECMAEQQPADKILTIAHISQAEYWRLYLGNIGFGYILYKTMKLHRVCSILAMYS